MTAFLQTTFLDRKLCIRKFPPQIAETFHLVKHDVGRRINNFSPSIQPPDLIRDVEPLTPRDIETVLRSSSVSQNGRRDSSGYGLSRSSSSFQLDVRWHISEHAD